MVPIAIGIAFGETFVEEHKNSINSPFKFNGKELDEESGLYYYGARYYDLRLSIWASVDPLANYNPFLDDEFYIEGEHNNGVFNSFNHASYSYCYQNPINLVDPNGKQAHFLVLAVIGGLVDYGMQVGANYLQNPDAGLLSAATNNISLSSIALSAGEAALTSGGSIYKKAAIKGVAMVANNMINIKTNEDGNLDAELDLNAGNVIKNTIIDIAVEGATAGIGKKAGKLASKVGVNGGNIAKTTKNILKKAGVDITRDLNKTIKKVSKEVNMQVQKSVSNTSKTVSKNSVDDIKKKTNEKK